MRKSSCRNSEPHILIAASWHFPVLHSDHYKPATQRPAGGKSQTNKTVGIGQAVPWTMQCASVNDKLLLYGSLRRCSRVPPKQDHMIIRRFPLFVMANLHRVIISCNAHRKPHLGHSSRHERGEEQLLFAPEPPAAKHRNYL